jgi:hypothetical protein
MATEGSWAEVNVKIEGFSRIDFETRKVRIAMRNIGRDMQREARKLVSRRAVSKPGEIPGRATGATQRSIRYRVSRPGFLVRIAPFKTADMGKDFYPAFLHYGSEKNNLKPRENYMVKALENRADNTRNVLRRALEDALVPRK